MWSKIISIVSLSPKAILWKSIALFSYGRKHGQPEHNTTYLKINEKKLCVHLSSLARRLVKRSGWTGIFKAAMSCYLLSFWKAKICLRINNWILKIMFQFCFVFLRLHLASGSVSCSLLLQMRRMDLDKDWNLKNLASYFKFFFF